ncbi:DEAD/DEAH box helicase [Castellaniella sp. FW104-16D08]|uniref:DEAD/DEAH box helicase n=1 Tax=unclassified Castellaniella TaxID=2617606 RepID=UPI003315625E
MTRQVFTPRPYQTAIIEHILDTPRCAVWAGMGMGKSVSTLTALDALQFVDPRPALVLAPKRVAASTWPDEAAKWEHLRGIEVSPILGTTQQRRAALRRDANVYTINYENVPWLVDHLDGKWPFGKIIPDESTRLKSFRTRQGGQRAQALGRVAHVGAEWFTELTGTPSPNGLVDLWGQAWFLDKGVRLGRSFTAFKNRWFQSIQVGADRHAVRLEPLPFAQTQIEDALRDLCLSLDARDYFDLDEPIVTTIRVELPTAARVLYRAMEREAFLALECGTEIEAFNAASKTMKCLQLANGAIYKDETGTAWGEVHDAKLQALDSIIQEAAGMPVLVAYHFKSDLARLLKAFPRGRHLDQDPQTIRDWNAGKIPVLFAHPASAGHGLNLQDGGNIIAFFGLSWNLEERLQIIERIGPTRQAQAGHDRPVFIYNIVAADTMDESVLARVESKREVMDILLEAMKRKAP